MHHFVHRQRAAVDAVVGTGTLPPTKYLLLLERDLDICGGGDLVFEFGFYYCGLLCNFVDLGRSCTTAGGFIRLLSSLAFHSDLGIGISRGFPLTFSSD